MAVLLSFAIFFAIPKAAALTIPHRWNNIPVGQKRSTLYQYLGKPINADTNFILKYDEWEARRENGEYVLTVFYNNDTASNSYALIFNYHAGFFHKAYLLREEK